ncbi:MAG: hypothetical protein VKL39_10390 [Leptolyngbyaceae bacterium]|nr:hypothetical protein [Leptolyngbyaceae bacterium]
MMSDPLTSSTPTLLPSAIGEITAQVARSKEITLADRYGLMAAILSDSLKEEERDAIDRLLRAVCRGRFTIVNDISALL